LQVRRGSTRRAGLATWWWSPPSRWQRFVHVSRKRDAADPDDVGVEPA
jgi:hypothetical protein